MEETNFTQSACVEPSEKGLDKSLFKLSLEFGSFVDSSYKITKRLICDGLQGSNYFLRSEEGIWSQK